MHTWLTYENNSLNPHISRIGLFWDVASAAPGAIPVLWNVIEKCRFGWHHPICIEWKPTFLLRDLWGNQRKLSAGVDYLETGTRVDGPSGPGLNSQIIITQKIRRTDLSFVICRNNRAVVEIPLSTVGTWALMMPDRLILQLDCPVKLHSKIINPKGTVFSLNGLRSLKVALRGGAPGAGSTPLQLISHGAIAA